MTATHVWSGEELYQGIDYCCDNRGNLYIVDPLEIIRNRRQRDIRYGCYPPKNTVREILKVIDRDVCRGRSLKKHIRINNTRTIPGSTLKGLIRTTYIYGVLKQDKSLLRQAENEVQDRLNEVLTDINIGRLRDARRKVKEIASGIEGFLLKITINMGNNQYVLDAFNRIIVSDPIEHHNLKHAVRSIYVHEIPRLRRGDNRPRIVVPLESVEKDSEIAYGFKILQQEFNVENDNREQIEKLYSKISLDRIRYGLKEFSKDLIDYELDRIRNLSMLRDYRVFLQDLKGKVNDNEFYLRIGYMTGHNAKTIDLLLSGNTRRLLEDVMSKIYRRVWDSLTLKLTSINNSLLGFGWVKITLS